MPESQVAAEGPEVEEDAAAQLQHGAELGEPRAAVEEHGAPTRPKVRPIQMGEFIRKWVSRARHRTVDGCDAAAWRPDSGRS